MNRTVLAIALTLAAALATAESTRAQAPTINLWDGPTQSFGTNGNPQQWINILGTVGNTANAQSLSYSLNGSPDQPLNMGPDGRRLMEVGAFNIEVDVAQLRSGLNSVVIKVTSTSGQTITKTVDLDYDAAALPPREWSVDWSKVLVMSQAVQVVDGRWVYDHNGIRPTAMGYDRLFAVGDINWDNFVVTVPVTINAISQDPRAYQQPSVSPGLGITGRWTGHTNLFANDQPRIYWLPQGGGPWYDVRDPNRGQTPELYLGGTNGMKVLDPYGRTLALGTKYWWKLRVESLPTGRTWYGAKIWESGTPEPDLYDMVGSEGMDDLQRGSVLMIAHQVDATFGNISVRDLDNDITAPKIVNVSTDVDDTIAILSWKTDEPASTIVEFGRTNSYDNGRIHEPELTTDHHVILRGLDPDTVYHFRVSSTDGRRNSTASQDATFRTKPELRSGGLPNAVLATEEFAGTDIDTATWQVLDPLGDCAFSVRDGRLRITATESNTHDAWTQGNNLPRVMRAAPDVDMDLRVKFDSALRAAANEFHSQGILIQQDPTTILRFELHSNLGAHKLFAASIVNNSGTVHVNESASQLTAATSPMWLRVQRAGTTWTISYSTDGTNWLGSTSFQRTVAVASVGLYAGNSAGSNFTSVVDRFHVASLGATNDTTAPTISGISVQQAHTSAVIRWTTDEPATSVVVYGTTTGYGQTTSVGYLTKAHEVVLTGLTPSTTYHFGARSVDPSGNVRTSANQVFTTAATGLPSSTLASDGFNTPTLDPNVWLPIDPLGDGTFASTSTAHRITAPTGNNHDVWDTNNSVPAIKRQLPNDDFDFHVKFTSTIPTNGQFRSQGIVIEQDATNLIRVDFHCYQGNSAFFAANIFNGSAVTLRSIPITAPAAPMYLRVARVRDDWTLSYSFDGSTWTTGVSFWRSLRPTAVSVYAGSSATDSHTAEIDDFYVHSVGRQPDTTPPVITNVQATPTNNSVTITWTTDEHARSSVDLGATTNYTANKSSAALTANHSVTLHGLMPSTSYHYRVGSRDPAGNLGQSADFTFTTSGQPLEARLISDDFVTLDTSRWTLVDPTMAASVTAAGGIATVSVPTAAVVRDAWAGTNTLPRIMQRTANVDFDVEAVFDTGPSTGSFSSQGIFIEQDPDNFLRAEFQSNGTSSSVFVATVSRGFAVVRAYATVAGTGPMSIRVARSGANWTVTRSDSQVTGLSIATFAQELMVTRVGVHAGAGRNANAVRLDRFTVHSTTARDTTPPTLSNIQAAIGDRSATIRWNTDEPASTMVRFGLTSALEIGELGTSTRSLRHTVQLPTLPATMYYYKLLSRDRSGNLRESGVRQLTTNASGGGGVPTLTSDTFSGSALDTNVWSFVNPVDRASVSVANDALVLRVPDVPVSHDVWTTRNTLARVMQEAPDADFEIEAKFTSNLIGPGVFKSHGILVEHDEFNVLRIEFHNWGGSIHVAAASIIAGTGTIRGFQPLLVNGPTWLRVGRVGHVWTVSYSIDGSNWATLATFHQVMTPRSVGVYAGAAPNAPHTVQVESFTQR